MTRRSRSGFDNAAADKIWNDHLGNNAFVRHREQCAICTSTYLVRRPGQPGKWCIEGDRIFDAMLDEVYERIDEALANQN